MKKMVIIAFLMVTAFLFLFPKNVANPGSGPAGEIYTKYQCFGFATHKQIADADLLTCYGIPYGTSAIY